MERRRRGIRIPDLPQSRTITEADMRKVLGGLRGDFVSWIYRPETRYPTLNLQQGRVLMDDDWNQ